MDELIVSLVANAPATAVLLYLLYMINGWGKELVGMVREIRGMLVDQSREEAPLSAAAQARRRDP